MMTMTTYVYEPTLPPPSPLSNPTLSDTPHRVRLLLITL